MSSAMAAMVRMSVYYSVMGHVCVLVISQSVVIVVAYE
jgi:hypothetical protein